MLELICKIGYGHLLHTGASNAYVYMVLLLAFEEAEKKCHFLLIPVSFYVLEL